MAFKFASVLGLATAATLIAGTAMAGHAVTSDDLLAIHIKQAQNRVTVAAQIEKAKQLGVGPVMAVKLDRIKIKQAANRRHVADQLARAYELGVSPVLSAQLEKIHAKQHKTRHQLAEKIAPEILEFNPSPLPTDQEFGG